MSYRNDLITIPVQLGAITALAGGAIVACRAPFAGTVVGIGAAVNGAFSATDIVITGRINTTGITNGVITLATAGSAFGTTSSATPTAANTFAAGDIIGATVTGGVGAVSGAVTFILSKN